MNRKERRKNSVKSKEPIYNLTYSQIESIKRNATEEAVRKLVPFATAKNFYFSMMILRDKYGFGKKRLGDFMEYMANLYESFGDGYLSLEDMEETIFEETGVRIGTLAEKFKEDMKNEVYSFK